MIWSFYPYQNQQICHFVFKATFCFHNFIPLVRLRQIPCIVCQSPPKSRLSLPFLLNPTLAPDRRRLVALPSPIQRMVLSSSFFKFVFTFSYFNTYPSGGLEYTQVAMPSPLGYCSVPSQRTYHRGHPDNSPAARRVHSGSSFD